MLTSIQRHCRTSGKVVHSDGKTEWWTFWILSRWFQPCEIPEHLNRFYWNQVCSCDQQEVYNQDKNLNQTCFRAERNWGRPKKSQSSKKKLEFLFFGTLTSGPSNAQKATGIFPPELKIQGNVRTNACKLSKLQENFHEFWQFLGSGEKKYL